MELLGSLPLQKRAGVGNVPKRHDEIQRYKKNNRRARGPAIHVMMFC
jgi:hypothetical protein